MEPHVSVLADAVLIRSGPKHFLHAAAAVRAHIRRAGTGLTVLQGRAAYLWIVFTAVHGLVDGRRTLLGHGRGAQGWARRGRLRCLGALRGEN